jgi:hypothetical protein
LKEEKERKEQLKKKQLEEKQQKVKESKSWDRVRFKTKPSPYTTSVALWETYAVLCCNVLYRIQAL